MSIPIDKLAERIAALDPIEQDGLLERVAELNYHKGLKKLTRKYRSRLQAKKLLYRSANDILKELNQIRDKIAIDEYSK